MQMPDFSGLQVRVIGQLSADLDARLVLLLANQVGDLQVLLDCIAAARAARG